MNVSSKALRSRARTRVVARRVPKHVDCPFCDYAGPNDVLWESPSVYVVKPLRQVTPGHVLVIPKAHAADFAENAAITAVAFRGAAEFVDSEELGDCNLITSKGEAASQTVKHVHIHVLPRTWDDAVRLPWNNPHESVSSTHHVYRRALRETDGLVESLSSLAAAEDGRFDWEITEARQLIRQANRYLSKVGEVLYCNWTGCLHADEDEHTTDYKGRAIPIGGGVPWFKGRIHTDCVEAMKKEQI